MNDIVLSNVMFGDEELPSIKGRDLHKALGVETRFNDWIIRRTKSLKLVEGTDFMIFTQNRVKM